jgi:hypothetical protein
LNAEQMTELKAVALLLRQTKARMEAVRDAVDTGINDDANSASLSLDAAVMDIDGALTSVAEITDENDMPSLRRRGR